MINGTYMWLSVTQIFRSGKPYHDADSKQKLETLLILQYLILPIAIRVWVGSVLFLFFCNQCCLYLWVVQFVHS